MPSTSGSIKKTPIGQAKSISKYTGSINQPY